eukprot:Opistho-2@37517
MHDRIQACTRYAVDSRRTTKFHAVALVLFQLLSFNKGGDALVNLRFGSRDLHNRGVHSRHFRGCLVHPVVVTAVVISRAHMASGEDAWVVRQLRIRHVMMSADSRKRLRIRDAATGIHVNVAHLSPLSLSVANDASFGDPMYSALI